jgi:sterol 3beta-glucosyltransferase
VQTSNIELPPLLKSQPERETIAMLEGKKENDKSQSDTRPFLQRGTVPSEADEFDDIAWDAPPPYKQSFGNDQRNVSTTVEGMWTSNWSQKKKANSSFI